MPTPRRRRFPVALAAVALVLAACNGTGSADPTAAPTSEPSPTTAPSSDPASPTPTADTSPTPSPTATPSPEFTGGIDPPTEAPEGFSEFSIPPPQDLTEQYAGWVLAEWYRAEDELIRMAVDAPDEDIDGLPEDLESAVSSLYAGDAIGPERDVILETVRLPKADHDFQAQPGSTKLSHIQLLDATQGCLFVRYVQDSTEIVKVPESDADVERIALFRPKPEIDASGFNPTPWHMTNRAAPQDVTGDSCE